jgi:hypothetical protein
MLQRGEERPRDFEPAQTTVRAADVHFVVGGAHDLRHYGCFGWRGLDNMGFVTLLVEEILCGMRYVVWSLGLGDRERALSS